MATRASVIQVGVVGAGFGGYGLTPAFRRDPRCRVVAIAASTQETAQEAAEKWEVPRACTWQELVETQDLDAIAIAAPPAIQSDIAGAALAAGKAVFAEKPLALTLSEAEAMTEAAEESGLANMVDYIFPELNTWRAAKTFLDSGQLGKVTHVFLDWRMESYDIRNGLLRWKTASEQGGGVLQFFGSHSFHYLEWMLGPIVSLGAAMSTAPGLSLTGDTLANISIAFQSGVTGSMTLSTSALMGNGHRLEVYGDAGTMVLGNSDPDPVQGFRFLTGTRQSGKLEVSLIEASQQSGPTEDGRVVPVSRLVGRFLDWVADGIPSTPNFRDGLRAQELLAAAIGSDADSGRRVVIPEKI
jgi:predicted dehydrogenase